MSRDTRAPERIYLQRDETDEFTWTWCADRINDEDVEYVRADVVAGERDALRKALHDAIRRPMGVVPDSAAGFYNPAEVSR